MNARLKIASHGFRSPRYWPAWLLWKSMRMSHALPLSWQRRLGRVLGTIARWVFVKQRRIARVNIDLCFPDQTQTEKRRLLRAHFHAVGISFFEMAMAWFSPVERIRAITEIHGVHYIDEAVRAGRPVLLWGAHFTCLDLGARTLQDLDAPVASMHNTQKNPLMDKMLLAGRSWFSQEQIPRDGIRRLLSRLKEGYTVVYLSDQTHIGNQSEILPFFGVPAATNTATSRIADRTNALILTFFYRRLPDDAGYRIDIGPPLDGVRGDDPIADAKQLFGALEDYIQLAPEQYLWTYKKFKRRGADFPDPYAR